MVREYFFSLAQKAAEIANSYSGGANNIRPEWIYAQWAHESADFSSKLAESNHNLGGLCQTEPNDTPQPDGDQYYINFPTFEACAEYFGRYLRHYREDGIYEAQSLEEYCAALKRGGYFGDELANYVAGTSRVYRECFA